jgi:hypothetical protein
MVARTRPQPDGLMLRLDRDGEQPERLRADDGRDALLFAMAMLLKHGRLMIGDRLSVLAADDHDMD